jgi:ankyrin repeat protein
MLNQKSLSNSSNTSKMSTSASISTTIFNLAKENQSVELQKLIDNTRLVDEDAVLSLINERDEKGRTALHLCATYACDESAVVLLRSGADHSLPDWESGWT